jgi:V8-like Glu-specific endopeptidase
MANRKLQIGVLGWALIAAGCGGEAGSWGTGAGGEGSTAPGESELGSTEQDLVGGTATNQRPAIGYLSLGCTATLVSGRYVATAAHCFSGTTGPQNTTFTARDTSGNVLATRTVTYGFAYGDNTTSPSTTDFAIGRLSSSISSATIAPIGFATTAPTSGTQVTAFGFGCNNRSTGAGGGDKEYLTYNFGSSTANCPGDSGGPRVFGAHNGSGLIWGINSGYAGNGQDIQADAVALGPQVLTAVLAFGGLSTTNTQVTNFPSWATTVGVKAVSGDFNADGLLDLALTGPSGWTTLPVAFGNGSGGFTVTNLAVGDFASWSGSARSVVAADFDADGDTDIALVGNSGWTTIPVAFSNRNGTFTVTNLQTPNIPAWGATAGASAVAGDFDADGDGDIALVGGSGWNSVPVAFSSRNGTFTVTNTQVTNFPSWAQTSGAKPLAGDFDGDGDADIALVGGSGWGSIPTAFSNRAGGFSVTNNTVASFPSVVTTSGVKVTAADFNADGRADIAAVGGSGWRTTAYALSTGGGNYTFANLPMADVPSWGNAARFVLSGRANGGSNADLVLLGGNGWNTIPVSFLAP